MATYLFIYLRAQLAFFTAVTVLAPHTNRLPGDSGGDPREVHECHEVQQGKYTWVGAVPSINRGWGMNGLRVALWRRTGGY